MQPHARRADCVIDCGASNSALAGIVMRAPDDDLRGHEIRRVLTVRERSWSSTLREMTGYALTTRTLAQRVRLRGTVFEIAGDFKCAEIIFRGDGSQAAFDDETGELLPLFDPPRHIR